VDLGASLRRQRARQQARPPLRDALELSLSLGARALAQRARDELAATGARPRTGYRRGVHSLTASERRVARLAASGRTNREIAEELYVSMKTVESHLRSVYSKLDITGRGHLAASLDRSSSEEPALPSRRG
jgi:DNA-binding CsgD family transcriptional regulator